MSNSGPNRKEMLAILLVLLGVLGLTWLYITIAR